MALNIFQVDKSNAEAGEDSPRTEVVGRFRAGYQASGRPVGLSAFRVTTPDEAVASKVLEVMGTAPDHSPQPEKWETSTDEVWEVFTDAPEVDIIVDGPGAIQASFVLWGQSGKILETDGTYLIEDGKVTDEVCTMTQGKTLKEILAAGRAGKGPSPSLAVYFTLADAPELGKFRFYSSSGTAIEAFGEEASRLEELEGPQRYLLALKKVEFERDGETIRYTKPVLTYQGAA